VLKALQPYRDGLVIGCECIFAWYWLAARKIGNAHLKWAFSEAASLMLQRQSK
jgi:hypothetical protein